MSGSLHIGSRLLLHPHRRGGPLPADAGLEASSTPWAGTTTACPPSAGSRTTSGCAATRPSPTTRTSGRPTSRARTTVPVCRPNFVALCHELTAEDEQVFEDLWRRLGLSVDWSHTYATIDDRAARAVPAGVPAQLARGEAYSAEAPTLWDVDFRTAVAQAELEDRERPGAYHRLRFPEPTPRDVEIETTRPELLAACVALVAHPDDDRYRDRFGTTVRTPLFGVEVPVLAHDWPSRTRARASP